MAPVVSAKERKYGAASSIPTTNGDKAPAAKQHVVSLRELAGLAPMGNNVQDSSNRMECGSSVYTSALGHDSSLLGPRRPRPHKIWSKRYCKVLVVGDSGLGKTTLVRSLLSTPGERVQVHDGSYTSKDTWLKDPESLCSTVSWRDEEDRCIWVYKVQDTPGYGDDLDLEKTIKHLTSYVVDQNQKWLDMEQSRSRKDDMADIEDPRVDICLFAIPPHRLRALDLRIMYEMGRHVPVVPVITKADTLTCREAVAYREDVAKKISNPMIPGVRDKINIFHFERDALDRAGITDHATPTPPFLVVASNEVNESMNAADPPVFWPERVYPWGVAECFDRGHSDLLGLRALLLKEALEDINRAKRQRYESWRRHALGQVRSGRRFRSLCLWTITPALACLYIGRTGIDIQEVRARVSSASRAVKRELEKRTGKEAGGQPAPAGPTPTPQPKKKQFFLF